MFYDLDGKQLFGYIQILLKLTYNIGNLKTPDIVPINFSFDHSTTTIHGEDKTMFLQFVSRMLKWQPEDRSTAKELLTDPWLRADFDAKNV